jgi:hypothetical protein
MCVEINYEYFKILFRCIRKQKTSSAFSFGILGKSEAAMIESKQRRGALRAKR